MVDVLFKDLKHLSDNLILPSGKEFDVEFSRADHSLSLKNKVLFSIIRVIRVRPDSTMTLNDLVNIMVTKAKSLCFLYVHMKSRKIKRKLQSSKFDIAFIFDNETLRDALLTPGKDLFHRLKTMMQAKRKALSVKYSKEINSFFNNWIKEEYSIGFTCGLQTFPNFGLNSNDFNYNSYDKRQLIVRSIVTALQVMYTNNYLIFLKRLSLFRKIMYSDDVSTYFDFTTPGGGKDAHLSMLLTNILRQREDERMQRERDAQQRKLRERRDSVEKEQETDPDRLRDDGRNNK